MSSYVMETRSEVWRQIFSKRGREISRNLVKNVTDKLFIHHLYPARVKPPSPDRKLR